MIFAIYEHGEENLFDEVERLANGPSYLLTAKFEKILHEQFLSTQALVASPLHPHVTTYEPTGALFASGKSESDFDGSNWTGTIAYGGSVGGGTTQVDYAIYEQARGGIHDWFTGAYEMDHEYEDAIHDWFSGEIQ
jgi:hypothetical protein